MLFGWNIRKNDRKKHLETIENFIYACLYQTKSCLEINAVEKRILQCPIHTPGSYC